VQTTRKREDFECKQQPVALFPRRATHERRLQADATSPWGRGALAALRWLTEAGASRSRVSDS
jgi:hypothetical protein